MFRVCPLREVSREYQFDRVLSDSPPFRPPVLEPRLDLRVGHLQGFREGGPFRRRQVLLLVKSLLELGDLQPGERRSGLLSLGRGSVLVRVSYPPRHGERGWKE